jgi:hypothetical protein
MEPIFATQRLEELKQIYHRWKQGYSNDARFGTLLPMIKLLGQKAAKAAEAGKM